jgi:thymidylate synthase
MGENGKMIQCYHNVEAYNELKYLCENGYRQKIERGSFAEEQTYRMQSKPVMIEILSPLNFLYLPKEVTVGMIERYYHDYLINPTVSDNEAYTYASRITDQLPLVMDMMRDTPQTNQASISISQPSDINLSDPPCLREITFSFFSGKIHMTSLWRSNDIGEAFLLNQGGLAMLLRDVALYAGIPSGHHFYVSPGAHIYHYGGEI